MNSQPAHSVTIRQADLHDPAEAARIEAFVAEHAATPFHRPAWLLAIEQGAGQRALGLVAERAGVLEGWLPLTEVRSPLFASALVSSAFGVGGGPLADKETTSLLLCRAAEELAQRHAVSSVEIRGGSAPEGWQAITGKHANFSRPLAADREAELLAIPRKARAEVRKCLQSPLEIVTGRSTDDLAAFYPCYAASVHNLGTPVFPRQLFAAVLDHFGEDADIITAVHNGQAVSSVLSLYHDGAVMPFWGGGGFAARALKANEILSDPDKRILFDTGGMEAVIAHVESEKQREAGDGRHGGEGAGRQQQQQQQGGAAAAPSSTGKHRPGRHRRRGPRVLRARRRR